MITNAFTCTGPYAILIMLGIKRAENRSMMPTPSSGRCAVTCSKSFNAQEYGAFVQWASQYLPSDDFERIPAWDEVKDWPGKVIGCCDYSARKSEAAEEWDEGYQFWWDLSEVTCFDRPIPCRGNVGMWQMPSALSEQVRTADELASFVGARITTAAVAERAFRLAIPSVGGNEGLFVLPLDDSGCALSEPVLVSLGDASTADVRPSDVFATALKSDARSIILAHNHPSGDATPSAQDRELTAAIVSLGERLGVKVLDHLVMGGDKCVSLIANE